MTASERHALLLIGHGSHLSPEASAPVHAHAERLRALDLFDEVGVAFWKEEPAISRALDQFDAEHVIAVPLFMSDGFFTREVVPRELGLLAPAGTPLPAGEVAEAGRRGDDVLPAGDELMGEVRGKSVRLTGPVGTHPRLADIVMERAREAGAGPADGVIVVGHGTRRSARSELAIHEQAARIRASGAFAEVVALFVDQDPDLREVFALTVAPRLVAVPLFLADGWHAGEGIPAELSAAGAAHNGRELVYARAAGTHPGLTDVILERAGRPDAKRPRRPGRRTSWLNFALSVDTPFFFGELRIQPTNWTAVISPRTSTRPAEPCIGGDRVRRLVRMDDDERYRPLPGARGLPGGWRVRDRVERIEDYVEAIYPLSVRQTQQADDGTLRLVPLDEVLARQAGRYRIAAELDDEGRAAARQVLCHQRCVKDPLWSGDTAAGEDDDDWSNQPVPCPEPCSVMVSLCREAALWQRETPDASAVDEGLPMAAFERPGNAVREAYLQTRYAGGRIIPLGPRHG